MKAIGTLLAMIVSGTAFAGTIVMDPGESLNFGNDSFVCKAAEDATPTRVFKDELTSKEWFYLGLTMNTKVAEMCAEIGFRAPTEVEIRSVISRIVDSPAGDLAFKYSYGIWLPDAGECATGRFLTVNSDVKCSDESAQTWCVRGGN